MSDGTPVPKGIGNLRSASIVGALLIFGCAVAYALTRPLPWLASNIPDDAFYYLKIARNISATGVSSFDGVNPTNGYHPAWAAVLALVATVAEEPMPLLRGAILTGFAFHVGTALLLWAVLVRWTNPSAGWIGGALWLINPLPINLALQAMEASVYVFALALSLWVYAARLDPHVRSGTPPPWQSLVLFGLSLSLCFLGRTEAIIIASYAIVGMTWALRHSTPARTLLVTGTAFLVGVAPWFSYSYWATGTPFQNSGAMKLLWASEGEGSVIAKADWVLNYVFGVWLSYPLIGIPDGRGGLPRVVAQSALTIGLAVLVWRGLRNSSTRHAALLAAVLLGATLTTGAIYPLFLSDIGQFWYKAQSSFILFVVVYVAAFKLLANSAASERNAPVVAWAAGALAALALLARMATLDTYPLQRAALASQIAFDRLIPDGTRLGCFNAGIPGYFSRHLVVNLDGLANNAVHPYYRSRNFDAYVRDANIGYIADERDALNRATHFASRALDLNVVSESGPSEPTRYLWRVMDSKRLSRQGR